MQTRDTAVAVFDERDDAEDAISALKDAGFRADQIGLVARDQGTGDQREAIRHAGSSGNAAGEGAVVGAVTGGLLGAWLVGLGSLVLPVVGPVIAAGAFATALVGTVAGAAIGAISGALVGMGIPEEEANWYEQRVHGGAWLVTVKASSRFDEARQILREYGGKDYETGRATTYRAWSEAAPEFRTSYERQYDTAATWPDHEPAHRFGYEAYGQTPEGTPRDWQSAQSTLRRTWESQGSGSWEANQAHIRHGYDFGRGRRWFREYEDAGMTTSDADRLRGQTPPRM
jgi:hypothetical protein